MPKPIFLQKCIELYETICVRHGLMVVGGAFSGKSRVINILKKAMTAIEDDPNFAHGVENFYINPKSIT
jgi:dynein heavy chain, axonemal